MNDITVPPDSLEAPGVDLSANNDQLHNSVPTPVEISHNELSSTHADDRESETQTSPPASVQGLNLGDVNDLGWVLEQNLKEIYKGIETLKKTTHQAAAAASSMQKPQWFPEEKMGNNNGDEAAQMGYGNAGEEMMMMMMPFNDNQNTMWGAAGSFFP
nr:agamous-like MADS-box protein AGL80 [Ipomoea trifida]